MEVANQQLLEVLRKLNADYGVNWVEALPATLRHIHDAPGESGLSPYQIVFGRNRIVGSIPYRPETENEDAHAFFDRMKAIDNQVARVLEQKHTARAARDNVGRPEPREYKPGDKVWYRRPEGSGEKLDTRWIGPCLVLRKVSRLGYEIQVTDQVIMSANAQYLKPYQEDTFGGTPLPLYHHRRTVPDPEAQPDEWEVETVVNHEWRGHIPFFQVKCKGIL